MSGRCPFASRRFLLAGAATGLAGLAAGRAARADERVAKGITPSSQGEGRNETIPFFGEWQGGILTATQNHTVFAAFDLLTDKRQDVAALMAEWTEAASRMARGEFARPLAADRMVAPADSGEAAGLAPARLTLTFGFGPTLFTKDGKDRFGLAARRPAALIDLPGFNGDQLVEARTGGDLSVQACADDPQVAFHAVRQLGLIAGERAQFRWMQTGFSPNFAANDTPRNLMGFKDGTQNPVAVPPVEKVDGSVRPGLPLDQVLWADAADAPWMRGGTYCVVRRIRISLEHWDRTDLDFQEQVIGRRKVSGAPLTGQDEFDPLDLDATDADGNPVIPEDAHVRMAAASVNGGAQILRRAYSFNDGLAFIAERWPPWRQGMLMDAGLLFICHQRDPRTGFVQMFEPMSKLDALNQFTTHVGGGLFAIPGAATPGRFVGQELLAI